MAYTDPRKNAKFVDDNSLRPRDNSGGSMTPMKHSTDFGETGASVKGGEANEAGESPMDEDEIVMKTPRASSRKGSATGY